MFLYTTGYYVSPPVDQYLKFKNRCSLMTMPTSKPLFFMNLLPEKKYRVPSWNFVEKNVLCEIGDEITRFDGTALLWIFFYMRKLLFFFISV